MIKKLKKFILYFSSVVMFVTQYFCFTNLKTYAEDIADDFPCVRETYLSNANHMMKPLDDACSGFVTTRDSLAFLFRLFDEQNKVGLNFSLKAYKSIGDKVKNWGKDLSNGMIYETCVFDEKNESNLVLAIFEQTVSNPTDHLIYKTKLKLIRKNEIDNCFYDLGAEINPEDVGKIFNKDHAIIVRIYKDECDEEQPKNNLLAEFCGGTADPYFKILTD